ncbi:MAG: site-2 protease family protein [Candidatus Vogelbacteria bacterium]|nr:site-2 protease family protein [Candidatus Vogelbacteria bacterium]
MASLLLFLIILAVLVLSHEFGHFLVAKLFGVRVDEFGFGFPPKLFSFKKGETEYSLNLLPFGGFVKIFGEDKSEGDREAGRSFLHQSNSVQASIIVAGVLFNFLLAWALLSIGFMWGLSVPADWSEMGQGVEDPRLLITDVLEGSPADKAGIKVNDNIIYAVSKDSALQLPKVQEFVNFINEHSGEELIIGFQRDTGKGFGDTQVLMITPKEGLVPDRAAIGVGLDMIGILRLPVHKAIYVGAIATYRLTVNTIYGLYSFASGFIFDGTSSFESVSGPVGLIGMVGETASMGFSYLLSLVALISINLGVLNIVPFPALDGGRLLFIIIGAIKKKPIRAEIQNYINIFGFAFLLLLMFMITWSDLAKVVAK